MMFQKLGTAILISAGLLCSLSVHAATYSLGILNMGDNEFGTYTVDPGSFTDRINFDLGTPGGFSGGVGSIKITVATIVKRDINNLALSIYDNADHLLPTTPGSGPDDLTIAFPLGTGHYHALVQGEGTGTLGGKYGGVFTITPTPEPETWAMMGLGLGLLKLRSRRKKALNS